tara:strand:+ start:710 stop:1027 length:318 start_codon:yes stop_codon:yes gene_type:complete
LPINYCRAGTNVTQTFPISSSIFEIKMLVHRWNDVPSHSMGELMKLRMFRATFLDAFSQHTIVVEFEAPFPIDDEVDYKKLATQRLGEMIRKGEVAIRDIEPIEI